MSTVPLKMNLQQTCRLCLGQGGVLSPIFAESVGGGEGRRQSAIASAPQPQPAQPTLPSRIMACAPIQVLEGDSLPAQICHRCLYQVERSYDFKEQCETSDRVLRQYVAQLQDKSLKLESCVNSQDVPSVVKLDKKESGNENVHVDLSFAKSSEFLLAKEIKVNVLQSKLSALIHQAAVAPEEDVDSGLLESLADSDDLQIVGSEGDNMNIGEEEEPFQEEATDLSMPSKKETPLNTKSDNMDLNDDESTMDTESDNQLQICEDPIDEGISDGHGSEKLDDAGEKQSGVESMVISVDPFQMERIDASMKHSDLPSNFSLNSVKSEFEKEEYSPNENDVVENIQENTKPYACEFCPKKFADKSYMKTHQLTHLGIRPHACSYCGKGFFRRRELLRHEAVHTGIKPFTCKTCNKAFARSDKLMRHERTHGELKNFSCTQCPAVFSRKDELSRHGMCHTGERPHCCSQCFKSFFSRAELTRHEKTHAGLKPFKCDHCDQSFHRRDKLNRHARTHMMPASLPSETNVLGTVHLHDLLAAHCGQHFASEVRVKDEKGEAGEELKVRVDGSIDARALARLNQNPDIHLIPLKQN